MDNVQSCVRIIEIYNFAPFSLNQNITQNWLLSLFVSLIITLLFFHPCDFLYQIFKSFQFTEMHWWSISF